MKKIIILLTAILSVIQLSSCSESETIDSKNSKFEALTAKEYRKIIIETESPQIIDVRTPQEFNSNSITGAVNINIYDSNFDAKIQELDKDRPVFLYCRSGSRSNKASNKLAEMGFTEVYDLKGGITSWQLENLSLPADNTTSEKKSGITIDAYNKLISNTEKLVLVDFNAEWCAPCKKLSPILNKIASENTKNVELIKIDVDENPTLSKSMRIQGLPTLKLYKNGEEVWQYLGLTTEEKIVNQIKTNI